jgi:hypothetical protein
MRKGFLAFGSFLACATVALAQPAVPAPPAPAGCTSGCASVAEAPTYSPDHEYEPPCFWASADYLLWWIKNGPGAPPLLTTSTTPAAIGAGALTTPGTVVLLGGQDFDFGTINGVRVTVGGRLGCDPPLGVEGSGFLLERRVKAAAVISNGGTPPFFTPVTEIGIPLGPTALAFPFTDPGLVTGAALSARTQLWGSEANVTLTVVEDENWCGTLLAGFRYLDLNETLLYDTLAAATSTAGVSLSTVDYWGTQNRFYGGQIGGRLEYRAGLFFVNGTAKVAIGSAREAVTVNGVTIFASPLAPPVVTAGGVFTDVSNINRLTHNRVTAIPDLQANAGVQLFDYVRLFVGYSYLYWGGVLRPGNQVDTRVDFVNVPAKAPVIPLATSPFWAQGVNFGIEVRF